MNFHDWLESFLGRPLHEDELDAALLLEQAGPDTLQAALLLVLSPFRGFVHEVERELGEPLNPSSLGRVRDAVLGGVPPVDFAEQLRGLV